jgi:hypothetical protein
MKKFFIAIVVLATAFSVSAQELMVQKTNSDFDYTTQVPVSIKTHFQTDNPTVSNVVWLPMGTDWWYATYKTDNNRIMKVYYNTEPWHLMRNNGFKASLPVFNTYVPDMVVANAINSFGTNLYSITRRMPNGNEEMYHVTVIKNGVSEIVVMNGQGVVYNDSNKGAITATQH